MITGALKLEVSVPTDGLPQMVFRGRERGFLWVPFFHSALA